MDSGLMSKRPVGIRVVKRKYLFQVRPRWRKPTDEHQVSPEGLVSQNEHSGIIALTAQTQQILSRALRLIEFAAERVIKRLPKWYLQELRRRTQLLPQLPCAGIGMARLRRGKAFESLQYCAQGAAKF